MTEAQKYEGALYKGDKKQGKNQRKGKNDANVKQIANGNHRAPYVEDAPDTGNMAPPPAPSPPPAGAAKPSAPGNPVNVFDYLVTDQTPNASKVSLKEQMQMRDHAPSVFEPSKALAHLGDTEGEDEDRQYDVAFEENGFSYGADPIPPSMYQGRIPNVSTEFMTPAPKKKKERSRPEKKVSSGTGRTPGTVSDKKRKRGPTEDHDMNDAAEDTPMTDAPSSVLNNPGTPMLNHSGLTGGLSRMLRSPSVEGEEQTAADDRRRAKGTGQVPSSPLKRTRRNNEKDTAAVSADAGLGISLKNRAGRIVSSMFGGSAVSGGSGSSNEPPSKALIRTRRRSSSDEGGAMEIRRSKKTHQVRNPTTGAIVSTDASSRRNKHRNGHADDRSSRRVKQIEYPTRSRSRSRSRSPRNDQVVVYRGESQEHGHAPSELEQEMAAHFLSLVTKGPDSSRGLSMNKTLKRFHRDFSDEYEEERGRGRGRSRADRERRMDDEKDLWRTLRLRKNERGEVVVFF